MKHSKTSNLLKDKSNVMLNSLDATECFNCNGTSYETVEKLERQSYSGILPSGLVYVAIDRTRLKCKDCGQQKIKLTYIE
jgi:hypothetical protein